MMGIDSLRVQWPQCFLFCFCFVGGWGGWGWGWGGEGYMFEAEACFPQGHTIVCVPTSIIFAYNSCISHRLSQIYIPDMHIYACINFCEYDMYICIYVYIYIMYVYIHIYIYIYAYVYIHLFIKKQCALPAGKVVWTTTL